VAGEAAPNRAGRIFQYRPGAARGSQRRRGRRHQGWLSPRERSNQSP